jgi:hypothetical protein
VACNMQGRGRNAYKILICKIERNKPFLVIGVIMLLERVLRDGALRCGLDSSDTKQDLVAGSCKGCNELAGSLREEEFLNQVSYSLRLKKDSVALSLRLQCILDVELEEGNYFSENMLPSSSGSKFIFCKRM